MNHPPSIRKMNPGVISPFLFFFLFWAIFLTIMEGRRSTLEEEEEELTTKVKKRSGKKAKKDVVGESTN